MNDNSTKASDSANEWARKRKEQLERSKVLREERKQSSVLKNTGEQFLQKNPHTASSQNSSSNVNSSSN